MNVLNNEQKKNCEGDLLEHECACSLKAMKNNKSPGSDGITTEFYKIFWNDIKVFLINSLNYLTEFHKQGIITLIPKAG